MDADLRPNSRQPEDTDFQQQRLKAWQPLLTPKWVIILFSSVTVIFCIIGGIILGTTSSVHEIEYRYDQLGSSPQLVLPVTSDMNSPVFVYYQLTNFYQNHRRYVKSRNDEQLQGKSGGRITTGCEPLESSKLNSKPLYPCGLIANSMFSDKFDAWLCEGGSWSAGSCSGRLMSLGNSTSTNPLPTPSSYPYWQKDGIAWASDKADKFKALTPADLSQLSLISDANTTLPSVTDEDFIVWMRTAGLPTFRKLYRIINRDIKKGDTIIINAESNYDVISFKGEKSIVVGTASWIGGKNTFLGWAYITVGIICAVFALAFLVKQQISPRKLGDLSAYQWSKVKNPAPVKS